MIEIIYPMLGMFGGIIGGKVAAQYILMLHDKWVENHIPIDFDSDKRRLDFQRVCNTVMYELSVKQQNYTGVKQ